jgi:hypothetical protein
MSTGLTGVTDLTGAGHQSTVQHRQQAVQVSSVCVGVFWLGRLFVDS